MGRFNLGKTTSKGSESKVSASNDQVMEMIRKKAFELYEKRGRKSGRSMNDWLEAERLVKQRKSL